MDSCNEIDGLATTEALQKFDTDGSPIKWGDTKMTAREKANKTYQTPYGSVQLERYAYQTSKGGRIYCPLEHHARIIRGATPNKLCNGQAKPDTFLSHFLIKFPLKI